MKVVLLLGPSSAGKSTICKELQNKHQWQVCSQDETRDIIRMEAPAGMLKILQDQGITAQLAPYMAEQEIVQLCQKGLLNVSQREHRIQNLRIIDPDFPDIEQHLIQAGFDEDNIQEISLLLRSIGEVWKKYPFPDVLDRIFTDAFNNEHGNEASVIIDLVPEHPAGAEKILSLFAERVEKFKNEHGAESIQSFVVLAYCLPEDLSNRIKDRNKEAELTGDEENMRKGLFPFLQLAEAIYLQSGL